MRDPVPDAVPEAAGLLTDLYQLTMASGYWKEGWARQEAVFQLFFRSLPFGSGYAIAAGLEAALRWLESYRFDAPALDYLAGLQSQSGKPLFEKPFLDALGELRLELDLEAVPEGTPVFPQEPLLRVKGPLLQCQLIESAILNFINFETLIATKAARITEAAAGDAVMEFGLRRAQGSDGAMAASRAAFIGGCGATSNVAAGKRYGIPVKGTHAHSWVMAFPTEEAAFRAYADAFPNDCIFLVDTYDTLDGVRHAIREGKRLRQRGAEMLGIRLDSGDLLALSRESRRLLDEAGFPEARIVASDELDEYRILQLKREGARIDVWGVGTRLVTAFEEPALGGVYKLVAIEDESGRLVPRLKRSADPLKATLPGCQQVLRFVDEQQQLRGDLIVPTPAAPGSIREGIAPQDDAPPISFPTHWISEPLLEPFVRAGERITDLPPLEAVQQRARRLRESLPPGVRRIDEPEPYPVGIAPALHELRVSLAKSGPASDALA